MTDILTHSPDLDEKLLTTLTALALKPEGQMLAVRLKHLNLVFCALPPLEFEPLFVLSFGGIWLAQDDGTDDGRDSWDGAEAQADAS